MSTRTKQQIYRIRRGCKRPIGRVSEFALYQRKRREKIRAERRRKGVSDTYVN
jgi:hypothetical protein